MKRSSEIACLALRPARPTTIARPELRPIHIPVAAVQSLDAGVRYLFFSSRFLPVICGCLWFMEIRKDRWWLFFISDIGHVTIGLYVMYSEESGVIVWFGGDVVFCFHVKGGYYVCYKLYLGGILVYNNVFMFVFL